ncbi:MAG: hypothetical protein J6V49_02820, partial [Bacteroidales bacterium]|nr:hypothetical protein [Bacteroidales bacterium]
RIVLLCFIVAAPVAWYIASHWLGQFVNRITLPWWMFLVVLAIIMSITIAIVSVRSWTAANANPSEELNQE